MHTAETTSDSAPHGLLDPKYLAIYKEQLAGRIRSRRGTTHISVIDGEDNVASLSLSNGEGSGYVIPDTGIVLNNMLGEEDLNPAGFHCWPEGERMTSMMAPTIGLFPDGRQIATGSGGSNRLRTAILQVLMNLIDFNMDVEQAVNAPRIHYEDGLLSIEGGFDEKRIGAMLEAYPDHQVWEERNLFFGGVHTVISGGKGFGGAGDPRRSGVCAPCGG
jgi:gamma-glutamyltranspeptidase/glutathione hydrolase